MDPVVATQVRTDLQAITFKNVICDQRGSYQEEPDTGFEKSHPASGTVTFSC